MGQMVELAAQVDPAVAVADLAQVILVLAEHQEATAKQARVATRVALVQEQDLQVGLATEQTSKLVLALLADSLRAVLEALELVMLVELAQPQIQVAVVAARAVALEATLVALLVGLALYITTTFKEQV
jgi:hypothetical protein